MRKVSERLPWFVVLPTLVGLALVCIPIVGLVASLDPDSLKVAASSSALRALGLSIRTSLVATAVCVLLGVPMAIAISRARRWAPLMRGIASLPLVLPPVVGGVALLMALGRRGVLGGPIYDAFGFSLPFTMAGAILAQTFVALPFMVLTVEGGIRSLDSRYLDAARTLGAKSAALHFKILVPLLRPSIVSGAVIVWARCLGEFGATITFAGNFPGRTQTLPLAIYIELQKDPRAAALMSLILVVISLTVLVGLRGRWMRTYGP